MQRWSARSRGWRGLGHRFEIGWRADHRAANVRSDAHRDHVALQALAEPHAGIETALDDIGETILDADLQHDVGIGRRQGAEPWRQHQMRSRARHAEPQIAGRPVARLDRRFQRQVDLGQRRTQPLQQLRAFLGRRDAAGAARQEPHAKPRLQAGHRVADRRWRDSQFPGRAAKTAALGNGRQHRQLGKMRSVH